jgi:hypothetical protein
LYVQAFTGDNTGDGMNTKYVNQLSMLSAMLIQKKQEVSFACKQHKPPEEISELKDQLVILHKKIRQARLKSITDFSF